MYPDRHKWSINNTCTSLLSRWMVTLTNELQLEILQNRERERSEKGDKGEKGEKVASDIRRTWTNVYRGVASVPAGSAELILIRLVLSQIQ